MCIEYFLYVFGHPRATWVFSKFQGPYEEENFSDSSFHHIFESESFRFPFFYEK